jgi:hypothetical protein
MLAFRGAGGEPLFPQESRTFRSNQLLYHQFSKKNNLLEKG